MQDKSVKKFVNLFGKCQKIREIPRKSVKKLGNTKNYFASVKKLGVSKNYGIYGNTFVTLDPQWREIKHLSLQIYQFDKYGDVFNVLF